MYVEPEKILKRIKQLEKDLRFAELRNSPSKRIQAMKTELAQLKMMATGLAKGLKKKQKKKG